MKSRKIKAKYVDLIDLVAHEEKERRGRPGTGRARMVVFILEPAIIALREVAALEGKSVSELVEEFGLRLLLEFFPGAKAK